VLVVSKQMELDTEAVAPGLVLTLYFGRKGGGGGGKVKFTHAASTT